MKRVIALGTASAALAGGAVLGTVGSASAATPQQATLTHSAYQHGNYRYHHHNRNGCFFVPGHWVRYWHSWGSGWGNGWGHGWNGWGNSWGNGWGNGWGHGGHWTWVYRPGHWTCAYW